LKIIICHILFFLFFNVVCALTVGGFRIVSDALVKLTPHEMQTALRDADVHLFVRPSVRLSVCRPKRI